MPSLAPCTSAVTPLLPRVQSCTSLAVSHRQLHHMQQQDLRKETNSRTYSIHPLTGITFTLADTLRQTVLIDSVFSYKHDTSPLGASAPNKQDGHHPFISKSKTMQLFLLSRQKESERKRKKHEKNNTTPSLPPLPPVSILCSVSWN